MNEFVIGQKVVCINEDTFEFITNKKIYEIIDIYGGYIKIINDFGSSLYYEMNRFKTIIQSIEDVIPGMTLTCIDDGILNESYAGKREIIEKVDSGGLWLRGRAHYVPMKIEWFKEYKPKESEKEDDMKKEYEVIEPFNLLDIYKKRSGIGFYGDFGCFFEDLLQEQIVNEVSDYDFENMEDIMYSESLSKNRYWLEEMGFIKEKKKDVELKPGMILENDRNEYKIIECGYDSYNIVFMLYIEENNFMYDYGNKFEAKTLSELNEITGMDFEVVDEG